MKPETLPNGAPAVDPKTLPRHARIAHYTRESTRRIAEDPHFTKRVALLRRFIDNVEKAAKLGDLRAIEAFSVREEGYDGDSLALVNRALQAIEDDAGRIRAAVRHAIWRFEEDEKEAARLAEEERQRKEAEARALEAERAEAERIRALLARHPEAKTDA